MFWPDPTHQLAHPSTHPLNYTPTHQWRSLHRFQIFKQNWNISISSSAIEFDSFRESPWRVRGWVEGVGGWWEGAHYTRAHAHGCMHTHACTPVYDIIGNSQGFPQWGLPFAIEIIMFNVYMCMHVCVHVCVCACVWGAPPTPSTHPKSRREPKTPKFNKSWTNRDNSILFEDSLPLNIPELI